MHHYHQQRHGFLLYGSALDGSVFSFKSSQPVNGNKNVIHTYPVFIHSYHIFNIRVMATVNNTMFAMVHHPPSEDILLPIDTSTRGVTSADPNLSING
jgi:hypothetical protein